MPNRSPLPAPYFIDEADAAIRFNDPYMGKIKFCLFTGWGEEDQATAELMAAAPDLLSALKGALTILQEVNARRPFLQSRYDAIQNARAAIAKAEGAAP